MPPLGQAVKAAARKAATGAGTVERLEQVAMRLGEKTWTGNTHLEALRQAMKDEGKSFDDLIGEMDQGFITSTGRFVDRKEARGLAEAAGQLSEEAPADLSVSAQHVKLGGGAVVSLAGISAADVAEADTPDPEYKGLFSLEERTARQVHQPDAATRRAVSQLQREEIQEALDSNTEDVKRWGSAGATGLHMLDFFTRGEGWRTAAGGVLDAAQEVLDTAEEFRRLTGNVQEKLLEAVGVPEQFAKLLEPDLELPEVEQPETAVGQAVRPVISFLAGALPINRSLKAAGLANTLTRDFLSSAAAGALTVPDNLYTLADSLAEVPGLGQVVPDFLRSDPGDTEAEAKLKRAMNEALGVGLGAALLRPTIAALKYVRAGSAVRAVAGAAGSAFAKVREGAAVRMRTFWSNNLVSGAATQVLNAGTNLVNTVLVPAERVAATALTRGPRAAGIEARATVYGLLQGIEDTFRLSKAAPGSRTAFAGLKKLGVPPIEVGTKAGEVAGAAVKGAAAQMRAGFEMASDPKVSGTFWRAFITGKGITDPRFTKFNPQSTASFIEPPDLRTLAQGGPLAHLGNWFDFALTSGGTGVTGARGLITSDEVFKTPLHRMELWRRAAQEGMELGLQGDDLWRFVHDAAFVNPSDDALAGALEVAQYGTFTRPLGKMGEAAIELRDRLPWGIGHAIFPFVSTPVNIFKWGALERTPLGLLSRQVRSELTSPDKYVRTLARMRMAYGSALMLMAAKWAAEGRMTGTGFVDPELRQIQMGDRPPSSILVGDHWVQTQRFAPWGTILGFGADLAQIANRLSAADYQKAVAAGITSIYRNTLDFPFTQGMSEISDMVVRGLKEGDPNTVFRFAGDIAATFSTPRILAQWARAQEPVARSARTILDQVRGQLPGFREDLPVMHDALGDEVLPNEGYGEGVLGTFTRLVVPLVIRKDEDRFRAEREFLTRYEIDVGMPQRQIGGVKIDEATFQRHARRSGQLAVPVLRQFIASGGAGGLTRAQVEAEVRSIFAQAREQSAQEILATNPVLASRVDRVSAGVLEREDASMQRGPFSLELPQ